MWPTIGGILLTMVSILFSLLKPWPFKYIVDGVLDPSGAATGAGTLVRQWFGGNDGAVIFWLCLMMVVISLLSGLVNLASNYLFIRVGLRALLALRTDLYSAMQALPLKFHDSRRSADSSFRVAYDSQSIQTIYNKGFAGVLSSVVTLIAALSVMMRMSWQLSLASLAILPVVMWAIRHYADRVRRQSTTIQERESDLLTLAQEGLSQIRMVHAFGREDFEILQFRQRAAQSLDANLRLSITTIADLMRGRTTLIITHRLTTVHGLGRIIVLKNGCLVEDGTGPELLALNGVYAALYRDTNAAGSAI